FFRSIGALNTWFPIAAGGFFAILPIFVLKSIFNARHGHLKEQAELEGRGELHAFFHLYLPKVWKPLLGLGVLQLAALSNAALPALMYVANPELYPPALRFLQFTTGGAAGIEPGDPLVLAFGAVISLPSLLLLLLFRPFLSGEVIVSQTR